MFSRAPLSPLRRRRPWLRASFGALVAVGCWSGCTSQLYCEYPTGPCTQAGGPTEAAVTAVAAGALWAGGGGCKIAGCRPPLVCNTGSGLCEHLACGENQGICPVGTRCDPTSQTCR